MAQRGQKYHVFRGARSVKKYNWIILATAGGCSEKLLLEPLPCCVQHVVSEGSADNPKPKSDSVTSYVILIHKLALHASGEDGSGTSNQSG